MNDALFLLLLHIKFGLKDFLNKFFKDLVQLMKAINVLQFQLVQISLQNLLEIRKNE
jgi:hypothetical protein